MQKIDVKDIVTKLVSCCGSQQALADQLGLPIQTVNNWYLGKSKPHFARMKRLLDLHESHSGDAEAYAAFVGDLEREGDEVFGVPFLRPSSRRLLSTLEKLGELVRSGEVPEGQADLLSLMLDPVIEKCEGTEAR